MWKVKQIRDKYEKLAGTHGPSSISFFYANYFFNCDTFKNQEKKFINVCKKWKAFCEKCECQPLLIEVQWKNDQKLMMTFRRQKKIAKHKT